AFAGERDRPLVVGRVAVTAEVERVDVGVARREVGRRDLAVDLERDLPGPAGRDRDAFGGERVFQAAAGIDAVAAGGERDPGAAVGGVDAAGPDRQLLAGERRQRGHRAERLVDDRDAAR